MDDEAIEFTKAMEGIDTIPGPTADERETVPRLTYGGDFARPRARALTGARQRVRSTDRRQSYPAVRSNAT
jgi:hypothetical protein